MFSARSQGGSGSCPCGKYIQFPCPCGCMRAHPLDNNHGRHILNKTIHQRKSCEARRAVTSSTTPDRRVGSRTIMRSVFGMPLDRTCTLRKPIESTPVLIISSFGLALKIGSHVEDLRDKRHRSGTAGSTCANTCEALRRECTQAKQLSAECFPCKAERNQAQGARFEKKGPQHHAHERSVPSDSPRAESSLCVWFRASV